MSIDGTGGLARDHGADHVADGEGARTFGFCLTLGGERVRRFTRLRNDHGERVRLDDRVAVAEFAAVIDFDRNARQLFDHELARERGVPAGAAGDNFHLLEGSELGGRDIHLIEEDAAGILANAAERGIADGARLLENLLEHEMLIAALFRFDGIPKNVRHLPLHAAAIEIGEPDALRREDRHVAVGEEEHVLRVGENGRDVAGDEVLVIADADHHRRAHAGGNDFVGVGA